MKNKWLGRNFVLFSIFSIALVVFWNSDEALLYLDKKSKLVTVCSNSGGKCVNVISLQDRLGFDYTTTTYLFWDSHTTSVAKLPLNYVVFDPEVSVDLLWQFNGSLLVLYEGGEYQVFGDIPEIFEVEFKRNG